MRLSIDDNELEVMNQAPVALTLLDLSGNIVWFNEHAPHILDRKPEYLGRDVREFHQPQSLPKIDAMLAAYENGDRREFFYRIRRDGKRLAVRVAPFIKQGDCQGLIHSVMLLKD